MVLGIFRRKVHQIGSVVATGVVRALDQIVYNETEAFAGLVRETVVADVMQTDARIRGNFHTAFDADVGKQDVVDSKSSCVVVLNVWSHFVSRITVPRAALAHVGGLSGSVVWGFALEEISASVLTVP